MKNTWHVYVLLIAFLLTLPVGLARGAEPDSQGVVVPILLYHRLGPEVADSMTVKTSVFASHLEYLQANGYTVIPLRRLIAYIAGEVPPPPAHSVVITADDGHKSVFTDMFPLVKRYHISPRDHFIYLPFGHIQCEIRHDLATIARDAG
jgi:hypothetical protein